MYLSISIYFYLSIYQPTYLPTYLPIHPSIHPKTQTSSMHFNCPCIHFYCMYVCLSVYLPTYLSIYQLSIYLPTHPPTESVNKISIIFSSLKEIDELHRNMYLGGTGGISINMLISTEGLDIPTTRPAFRSRFLGQEKE